MSEVEKEVQEQAAARRLEQAAPVMLHALDEIVMICESADSQGAKMALDLVRQIAQDAANKALTP